MGKKKGEGGGGVKGAAAPPPPPPPPPPSSVKKGDGGWGKGNGGFEITAMTDREQEEAWNREVMFHTIALLYTLHKLPGIN